MNLPQHEISRLSKVYLLYLCLFNFRKFQLRTSITPCYLTTKEADLD